MTERAAARGPAAGRNFIAGEWIEAVSGRTFESRNPADRDDLVGTFQASGAADVPAGLSGSDAAGRSSNPWPARLAGRGTLAPSCAILPRAPAPVGP